MPIWTRTIRGEIYLYWKTPEFEKVLGKRNEILSIYQILRKSGKNQSIVLSVLEAQGKLTQYDFFIRAFGTLKKEFANV